MPDAPKDAIPATINFDYIKGSDFRVFHVDGAFLAIAPNGLTMSFFSERQPIPRRVVHKVISGTTLGEEIVEQRVVRDAMIRDVDVSLAMSIEVARNVYKTLGDVIAKYEETAKAPKD